MGGVGYGKWSGKEAAAEVATGTEIEIAQEKSEKVKQDRETGMDEVIVLNVTYRTDSDICGPDKEPPYCCCPDCRDDDCK